MKLIAFFQQYRWYIFSRIVKNILRKIGFTLETYYLLFYEFDKKSSQDLFNSIDYSSVKILEINDLKHLHHFSQEKKELLKQRLLTSDYSGYALWKDEKIIYVTWISWSKMNYPSHFNLQYELNINEALLEDSFCHPDFRGRGLHFMMNNFRMYEIFKKNKTTVLALVLKENIPALKVQIKCGFQIKKKINLKKFGNRTLISNKKYND